MEYVQGIAAGDRVILGRAITLVESELPADQDLAGELIDALLPRTGRSRRIGVSGVPGAGKSTFLEALGTYLTTEQHERVAVLSVDPSSPVSGGSILGDKTRMERLATDECAFIRPSPSRGHLGGVARRTREAMLLCEAAGYNNVFIETVGVGQSEMAVRSLSDFFLLLLVPGAGDELQGMKRGILEMIDLIAVNKADGDWKARAEQAKTEYSFALHLFPAPESGWQPRVVTCSARTREGISGIWDLVLEHESHTTLSGARAARRREQSLAWMRDTIAAGLQEEFTNDPNIFSVLPQVEEEVWSGRRGASAAARELLNIFRRKESL